MPGWHGTSRHERGYGYQWTKLRSYVLARDSYLCIPCRSKDRPTPATEVDHIVPKSQDGEDDMSNLQAICHECHSAKTKRESAQAAGKQSFGVDGWPI